MKNTIRKYLNKSAKSRWFYRIFWHRLGRLTQLARREHDWQELQLGQAMDHAVKQLCTSLLVRTGTFAGMEYPDAASIGSSLYPKLLGSYEQELQPVLQSMGERRWTEIVDIGCAEGYYAVGLARCLPEATVYAYDIVEAARDFCLKMARANRVESQLVIRTYCDERELSSLELRRALILCDCEGFERNLFTPTMAKRLERHDLLIEMHDFIDPFISSDLRAILSATHSIQVIRSVPDALRPTVFKNPVLAGASEDVQIAMMAELRPADMKWFWCTPLSERPE